MPEPSHDAAGEPTSVVNSGRGRSHARSLARTWDGARTYLLGGGVIYLVLFVYGLLVSSSSDANFVPVNTADDWLHLLLGLGLLGSWFATARERPAATAV